MTPDLMDAGAERVARHIAFEQTREKAGVDSLIPRGFSDRLRSLKQPRFSHAVFSDVSYRRSPRLILVSLPLFDVGRCLKEDLTGGEAIMHPKRMKIVGYMVRCG